MSSQDGKRNEIVVIKIGGSILTGSPAYKRVADFLRRRLFESSNLSLIAVVSAENGHTDELFAQARRAVHRPNPVMLDLLWSTGELRSVALLTLSLHSVGVRATGLNVHQAGLICGPGTGSPSADSLRFEKRQLARAIERFRVVVVPGFLAVRRSGSIVSLGRGGSDLSAVLLAAGLGAASCELIKDVPGYFTADPLKHADATHIPHLTFARARAMAAAGCDLVQAEALEAAARNNLRIVIRSVEDDAPQTEISTTRAVQKDLLPQEFSLNPPTGSVSGPETTQERTLP